MSVYPKAVNLIGSVPQTNESKGPVNKDGCALHVIVGSARSAISEFQAYGAGLSATLVVAGPGDSFPDGTAIQLLDNRDICYAQANGNWPPDSHNAVEVAGTPDQPMTPLQLATVLDFMAWDAADCGYPFTKVVEPHGTPGLTTHCNPDGTPDPAWGNHPCPGLIRLNQFKSALGSGGEVNNNDITDVWTPPPGHPDFGSSWQVAWDGGVFTHSGTKFFGSYHSLPPQLGIRNFWTITGRPDGKSGYIIWGNDGSYYTFGPGSTTKTVQVLTHTGEALELEMPEPVTWDHRKTLKP